jgi:plastocyanin domain-containing protein
MENEDQIKPGEEPIKANEEKPLPSCCKASNVSEDKKPSKEQSKSNNILMVIGIVIVVIYLANVIYSYIGQSGNSSSVVINSTTEGVQDIYIRALSSRSYDPMEITVKKGIPVRLHFTADANAGCGRQMVLYGLNQKVTSIDEKEGVIVFTLQEAGTYEYNCGMKMWSPGKLVVQ